jgi:tetratricopeptide (TPR) repeat protein
LWIAIGVLAVALLGAGGYYAWGILFPKVNMAPLRAPPRAGAGQAGPEGGETGTPPEAGEVASGQEPAPPDAAHGGTSAVLTAEESQARSKEQMRAGISMFRLADYATAVNRFDEALQTDPANFEAQDWLGKAQQAFAKVQKYQTDVESIENDFEDGNYHRSLYKLYRLEPSSPEEQETLDGWIGVCWYNWGVTLLKQRKVEDAEEKFEEVLGIRPDDPEVTRHLALVRRYNNRKIDEAYDTYTRRLTLRPLN